MPDLGSMFTFIDIAARVVAIAGICFISIFAIDIFELDLPPLQKAIGMFMHLLPSLVLIAILLIAWRWRLAGAILYLIVAAVPFLFFRNNAPGVNLTLAAPFMLAAALFVAAALTDPA